MSGQSTAGAFIPLIHSQLAELKKQCGGFGHRKLRDAIAAAEVYLQSVNSATENVSLEKSLEPFFTAMAEKKRGPFQLTVLDCFFKVFRRFTGEVKACCISFKTIADSCGCRLRNCAPCRFYRYCKICRNFIHNVILSLNPGCRVSSFRPTAVR